MTIEQITSGAASTISDLDPTLPAAGDPKSEGDNHLRNTKKSIQLTFPGISATVSGVASELAFAHKGGTVSGNAFIKGKIDCGSISVSSTAVINTKLIAENAAVAGTFTVSGASTFVTGATFEATVTISHLVANNMLAGRFQSKGTKVAANADGLTISYISSGQYKVQLPFSSLNYAAQATVEDSTTFAVAQIYDVAATEFTVQVQKIALLDQPTAEFADRPLHVTVHKL